jgi:hypothetical protein
MKIVKQKTLNDIDDPLEWGKALSLALDDIEHDIKYVTEISITSQENNKIKITIFGKKYDINNDDFTIKKESWMMDE